MARGSSLKEARARFCLLVGRLTFIWQKLEADYRPTPLNLHDPEAKTVGRVSAGITWDATVDLDLFVKHRDDDQELSYGRTRSRNLAGVFVRDIQSRPETNGFETIYYGKDVDLRRFEPIYVNFYGGRSRNPIEGQLRLQFGDQIYVRKFRITAQYGNKGRGNRDHHPCWVKFTIPEILAGELTQPSDL
ncbi:hypothetical protein [Acanthopleuribacter pedis]|uniref:Uncharacterized protein n=1 Tax=Acanthopleuribacter pedis TaxID=442870 RepID=A0A8J7Q7C2_9BACT|nr:hypothetical protein [Acanthopleuribacter pedis]MBO1321997.1 hypothetical protein [Acanthopleuribacter pedis]